MRCPKCNNEQNGTVECEVCGVIFARYQRILDRKKEREEQQKQIGEKSGQGVKILQVLLLVVVVAAVTYYFTTRKMAAPVAEKPSSEEMKVDQPPVKPVDPPRPEPARVVEQVTINVNQSPPSSELPGNIFEKARKSTVMIEASGKIGSGFFINSKYVVTNRHVVEFDEKERDKLRAIVARERERSDLERQKINKLRKDLPRYEEISRRQVVLFIEESEEALKKAEARLKEMEEQLAKLERKPKSSDIKIVFADGKSLLANNVVSSKTVDLALLSFYSADRPFLERPPKNKGLQQGDKIYAIGSPRGLANTMSEGIVSSFRSLGKNPQVYIQITAAVNPGNSGGPIIDESGYVRGVTTLSMLDMQGVSFAIPIEKVYEEFGSLIH